MATKESKKALSLSERLSLAQILPQEGTWDKLTISEDVEDKIKITQKEIKDFDIRTVMSGDGAGFSTQWDGKKCPPETKFNYSFTELEEELIVKELKDLSEKEKLHRGQMSLYKQFVKGK